MSAERSRRYSSSTDPYRGTDMSHLRARRRAAERRRRLARLDVALGVAAAVFVFIVSPGLAITAIVALLTLLACGVSVLVQRRRRRGAGGGSLRRLPRTGARASTPRSVGGRRAPR